MKKLLIFYLSTFLFVVANAQTTAVEMYVSASSVNVREEANTNSRIVYELLENEKVTVESTENNWSKISIMKGNTVISGYVYARYLSPIVTKESEKAKTETTMVLICKSKSAYAYHSHYCSGLNRCRSEVSKISIEQAKSRGYKACKICY